MKKRLFIFFLLIGMTIPLFSDLDLEVQLGDIRIEQSLEGGYHLWIRKKPDIKSVLLTESSADPDRRAHSYTLRNPDFHPVNGDERRILDGKFIESRELFFLMDSTPERASEPGEALHIFIPYLVVYGYVWSRSGEIQVIDGTFLNIRSFARPFADYEGTYLDNPFRLTVTQLPVADPARPEGEFMEDAVESFSRIAEIGGGKALKSAGKEDLIERIGEIIDDTRGKSLDLVLALDTTRSMENDMPALKGKIVPLIAEHTSRFNKFRVGLLFFRDYFEQYLAKPLPFEHDLGTIQRYIDRVRVLGGRDIPEAVFEALYSGIHSYDWQADSRLIILIGDAPPHPRPRGKITEEMVYRDAKERGIEINTIILPQ